MAGRTFSGEDVAGSWDSNTVNLFRVDPDTGSADTVDLGGEVLPGPDGLEMRENTLYVVGGGMVTVVRLGARLASGCGARRNIRSGPRRPDDGDRGRWPALGSQRPVHYTADSSDGYWITQLPLRPESG